MSTLVYSEGSGFGGGGSQPHSGVFSSHSSPLPSPSLITSPPPPLRAAGRLADFPGDVQDFFHGGDRLADFSKAVVAEFDHSVAHGEFPQVADVGVGDDGVANLVVDGQQLVDGDPALESGVAAASAAHAFVGRVALQTH